MIMTTKTVHGSPDCISHQAGNEYATSRLVSQR